MSSPPTLRSERLILRPFGTDDLDAVYAYVSDPEWWTYLSWVESPPMTRAQVQELVAVMARSETEVRPYWAVVFEGALAGHASLKIDARHRLGEVGYELARSHWGQGIATEAAAEILRWGFEECALDKVVAGADARNAASIRVMEKLGMQREAYLREERIMRGERVDKVRYGILRDEWLEGRRSPTRPSR